MNGKALLEFELVYDNDAVQYVNHLNMEASLI